MPSSLTQSVDLVTIFKTIFYRRPKMYWLKFLATILKQFLRLCKVCLLTSLKMCWSSKNWGTSEVSTSKVSTFMAKKSIIVLLMNEFLSRVSSYNPHDSTAIPSWHITNLNQIKITYEIGVAIGALDKSLEYWKVFWVLPVCSLILRWRAALSKFSNFQHIFNTFSPKNQYIFTLFQIYFQNISNKPAKTLFGPHVH